MIIGLTGKKGSGKDTLADYLVKNHSFIKLSFAKYLKNFLKIMFDWDDNMFSQENKEKICPIWGIYPREMMQYFGTDVIRIQLKDKLNNIIDNTDYSYHIKRLNSDISKNYKNKNIVISDVRFQDEIDYIKSKNGIIIKINRDIKSNNFSNHTSENQELNKIDYNIDNNENVNKYIKNFNNLQLVKN